jgi:hypothetical protein
MYQNWGLGLKMNRLATPEPRHVANKYIKRSQRKTFYCATLLSVLWLLNTAAINFRMRHEKMDEWLLIRGTVCKL